MTIKKGILPTTFFTGIMALCSFYYIAYREQSCVSNSSHTIEGICIRLSQQMNNLDVQMAIKKGIFTATIFTGIMALWKLGIINVFKAFVHYQSGVTGVFVTFSDCSSYDNFLNYMQYLLNGVQYGNILMGWLKM